MAVQSKKKMSDERDTKNHIWYYFRFFASVVNLSTLHCGIILVLFFVAHGYAFAYLYTAFHVKKKKYMLKFIFKSNAKLSLIHEAWADFCVNILTITVTIKSIWNIDTNVWVPLIKFVLTHTKLHHSMSIPCFVGHNLIIATRYALIPVQFDFDAHQLNQQQTSPRWSKTTFWISSPSKI